jgi:hypothetical protein
MGCTASTKQHINGRVVNNEWVRMGIGLLVPNLTLHIGIFLATMRNITKNLGIAGPLAWN